MDLSRFRLPEWLVVGGGAVVFILGFFNWFDTGGVPSGALKFTITGIIPWLLISGTALLTFQIRAGILRANRWPWPVIFVFTTAIGALLILIRTIIGTDTGEFGFGAEGAQDIDRQFTLWLTLAGALTAAIGAAMIFRMAGGTVADLPLIGKMREAGQQASQRRSSRPARGARSSRGGRADEFDDYDDYRPSADHPDADDFDQFDDPGLR